MQFNPMDPEFHANPYPTYAQLREESPVYLGGDLGFAAVSRYDDVVMMLKRHDIFSSSEMGITVRGETQRSIINTDPPDHTQIRNLANRAFTPRMVTEMEPRIREITAGLLDTVVPSGSFDVVRDLAVPLPVTVIAEILGVDAERHADFKRWSTAILLNGDLALPDERTRIAQDIAEFEDYFEAAIDERRERPRNDLISVLVAAEQGEHPLAPKEVLAFVILLLIAGNETTTNLIGNMMLALMRHPDEVAKVVADRTLIPNVVEESLRYDAPVQFLARMATTDTEIAGVPIAAGTRVLPLFGSANRDERRFEDPDRFDVTRNAQGHVAFGHGIHFCLGAPLARIEARVALEEMLKRLPGLRRAGEEPVTRVPSMFLRGLTSLPLTFDAKTLSR